MEAKKTENASLENKRLLFFEAGAVAALITVLCAFTYSTTSVRITQMDNSAVIVTEEDQIPATMEEPPAPPEVPQMPTISEIIEIVENDEIIETSFQNIDDIKDFSVAIKDYIPEVPDEENLEDEAIPFTFVEIKPSFQGSDANAFSKWVNSHLNYPEIAKENGVQGRVTLQFTVGTDGSVSDVRVLRGVDSALDKEAVRVVSSSPKWQPGRQRDRAVKVTYTFPVIFQLR